jgi:hypothetical protein
MTSCRVQATLPLPVALQLQEQAKQEGRSTSNLAAFLIEQAVQKRNANTTERATA